MARPAPGGCWQRCWGLFGVAEADTNPEQPCYRAALATGLSAGSVEGEGECGSLLDTSGLRTGQA